MGRTCQVICCSRSKDVGEEAISLFSTKNRHNREQWVKFLQAANKDYAWTETEDEMYVCSLHFSTEMLGGKPGNLRVLKCGYPSIVHKPLLTDSNLNLVQVNDMKIAEADVIQGIEESCQESCMSEKTCMGPETDLQPLENSKLLETKDNVINVLQDRVSSLETMLSYRKTENKNLEQKCKRIKRRLTEAKASTKRRKKMEDTFTPRPSTLVDELKLRQSMRKNAPYSNSIKNFAFKVHYRSPSAYDCMNEELKVLPHPHCFHRWTKHIPTKPGFLPTAIKFMKKLNSTSKYKMYYAISIDEVYIKKEIVQHGEFFYGYTDYGGILNNETADKEAKTALFIMATTINGKHKFPIAYLLTDGLNASQLSIVIQKSLNAMHESNSVVVSITFDGLKTNLSAAALLGANFDVTSENFKPYILDSASNRKVYIILDPSHMMKLIRNLWSSSKVIYSGSKEVKWSYIEELFTLQKECGMKVANKISSRHVLFQNQKMKTKLCVQTLSNSVAVALGVCRELEIEAFLDAEATEEFLKVFDRLFDILNSKSRGKGWKAPLRSGENLPWKIVFQKCREYLPSLMIYEKGKLVQLLKSSKRTAVIGLLTTIRSVEMIVDDYVSNPDEDLQYFPVYKVSQDMLETFFSQIRARFGFNDNPNALRLEHALRAILCMNSVRVNSGNCEQDNFNTRLCPLGTLDSIMRVDGDEVVEALAFEEQMDLCELVPPESLPLVGNIIAYVAGFVGKSLCWKLKCAQCICKLGATEDDVDKIQQDSILILAKDRGGLFLPSLGLISVCKIAERVIRQRTLHGIRKLRKSQTVSQIFRACYEKECFKHFECTSDDKCEGDHAANVVREVAKLYTKVRFHYIAVDKTLTINPTTNRSMCKNDVQFKGN